MIPDPNDGSKTRLIALSDAQTVNQVRDPGLGKDGFLQSDVVCNSVTNDPTGLVTVRTAIVPMDSPRRYIKYAATAPATMVPQNNALFMTAPLQSTWLLEACACHSRMQKAAWRGGVRRENIDGDSARARSRPEGQPIGRGIVDLELAGLVLGHGEAPVRRKESI
jgi:hypothetical protein